MKTNFSSFIRIGIVACALLLVAITSSAQNNSWLSGLSGKWENGTNWSLGVPTNGQNISITNAGTKTVTIDSLTTSNFAGSLSVQNLNLFSTTGTSTNVLSLANAGFFTPLNISSTLTVGSGASYGILTITNSEVVVGSQVQLNRGTINFSGGLFSATNSTSIIGNTSAGGNLVVNSGSAFFGGVNVGEFSNTPGTWTINGGTNICYGIVVISDGTGSLTMNGGRLVVTNAGLGSLQIASNVTNSIGSLTMSSGEIDANFLYLGTPGQATLSLSGGLITVASNCIFGLSSGSSGVASLTGGTLAATNGTHTANLDLRRGSLTNSNAGLLFDNLIMTNGATLNQLVSSNLSIGSAAGASNNATISGGSLLNIANAAFGVGNNGTTNGGLGKGTLTISNGTLNTPSLILGSATGGTGTLNMNTNATLNISSNLTVVSASLSNASSVVMAGGSLNLTNGSIFVGTSGNGLMTVSNGSSISVQSMKVGGAAGSSGTLAMYDGTLHVSSLMSVNSTNSVDLQFNGYDILIDGTGATLNIGDDSPGTWNAGSSGATANFANINVGKNPGCTGNFLQSAGQTFANTAMIVGNCVTNAVETVGNVVLSGGALYVTNSTHTAVFVVRNGNVSLSNGAILVVDKLIMTNACGQLQNLGGSLTYSTLQLDPNLDADSDGMNNAAELAAGTDPFDPNSYFRITTVKASGPNAVLTWSSVPGKSYYVQACTNKAQLNSGHFLTIGSSIPANSSGDTTRTSTTIPNGATNSAVFYRIKLGP